MLHGSLLFSSRSRDSRVQLLLLLARAARLCLRWNFLFSIGKQPLNFLKGGTITHNFPGKSDSKFKGHVVSPAIILGHNGGTIGRD